MSVRYPLTRARISTYSLAANCPVYSSHSTSSRWIGWLTVTVTVGGAAGASAARLGIGYQDPKTKIRAANRKRTLAGYAIIGHLPRSVHRGCFTRLMKGNGLAS